MTSSRRRTTRAALAVAAVGALLLTACSGGGEAEGDASADGGSSGDSSSASEGAVTLRITTNAIVGGKNAAEAEWLESYVIPGFEEEMTAQGKDVSVEFEPQGVDDEDYKTKIALDLQSGGGADIVGIDGIWVGEFAEAGYIKPLSEVAGAADSWEGWTQIPEAVQGALSFEGERYGVPQGADGRVLYYNKEIFEQAGLPSEWNPTSWEDVLEAARAIKESTDAIPIQLNAGTAMGEATTMQGLLPLLVGTGEQVWEGGTWVGDTAGMQAVLDLYRTIYVEEELGDPILQQEASGRDTSFQLFAEGSIGILLEGDYFWRAVVNPAEGVGTAPMANRDEIVGYTLIPAQAPGKGVGGSDFVSMSGGSGRVLNPSSANADLAWELLAFMNSKEAFEARTAGTLSITPRNDVNDQILANDPMLLFVSEQVLPVTHYRPGLAAYPQVSVALQQATLDVVTGQDVGDVLGAYADSVAGIVGDDAVGNR